MGAITSCFYGITLGKKLQKINYMAWTMSSFMVFGMDAWMMGFFGLKITSIVLSVICIGLAFVIKAPKQQ